MDNIKSVISSGDILIVDDVISNLDLLEAVLLDAGYKTRCTHSGESALIIAETLPIELILLDIKMDGMDGFETCRHLKENIATRDIPVIFISAMGDEMEKIAGFESGGIDYITKPFFTGEVLSRVNAHLNASRARAYLDRQIKERTEDLRKINKELISEIKVRKEAEKSLKIMLNEKTTLIKELHHRVKNNMQVISSMLQLQLDTLSGEKEREFFLDFTNRIEAMAIAHESMYQSDLVSNIKIKGLINSLIDYYGMAFKINDLKDKTEIHTDDAFLSLSEAVPCAIIINELMTNSIKHTFINDGLDHVSVSFKSDNLGSYILEVSDNGNGLPDNISFHKPRSLGILLVNVLTKQLKGKIEYINSGKGTTVRIKFPEKNQYTK